GSETSSGSSKCHRMNARCQGSYANDNSNTVPAFSDDSRNPRAPFRLFRLFVGRFLFRGPHAITRLSQRRLQDFRAEPLEMAFWCAVVRNDRLKRLGFIRPTELVRVFTSTHVIAIQSA